MPKNLDSTMEFNSVLRIAKHYYITMPMK